MLSLMTGRNAARSIRVLILDDSAVTAELTTRELERAGMQLVSERVDTEKAFIDALRSFAPDLIISAPSLPEFSARAALKLLQSLRPIAALIVVAEHCDEQAAVSCLRAGAETMVLRSSLSRLGPAAQEALSVRLPLRRLTKRQLEVLRLVTEGHTSKEIASGLGLSVKTVETHRGAGMRRLGIEDVAGLVRYAVRVGLIAQANGGPWGSSGVPNGRLAASMHPAAE